ANVLAPRRNFPIARRPWVKEPGKTGIPAILAGLHGLLVIHLFIADDGVPGHRTPARALDRAIGRSRGLALLCHMSQLVSQQPPPRRRRRGILARAEHDVSPERVSL